MNEILKMLNALTAEELDGVIMRANIMLEKKRQEEAQQALIEKERLRQEKIQQERKRQQEIAELQRKLQELQRQQPDLPEPVNGSGFVMQEAAAPRPAAPAQPSPAPGYCPHCGQANPAGSRFCAVCGQQMHAPAAPQPAPAASVPAVQYADEGMKKWERLPGERNVRGSHEIVLLQPEGGKYAYSLEITNQRLLFSRESSASRNAGFAARMGGGLIGSLIAEGVKSASGAGPRPWLAIPLTAISHCGLQNKKEFFITADRTYVLKNKGYDQLLPDLMAQAGK